MEYWPGGELFFHLQNVGEFDEDVAKFYAAQLVLAIGHLHQHDIMYRDLKPENVLIWNDGYIKLTDFGLAKLDVIGEKDAKTFCGTPEYLAPEIISKTGYGKNVDWWMLGWLIFEMIAGVPPFYFKNREKLFKAILFHEPKYPKELSSDWIDLIENLLLKDSNLRLGSGMYGFQNIKDHPWFKEIWWNKLLKKQLTPPFKPILSSEVDTRYVDIEFTKLKAEDSAWGISKLYSSTSDKWTGFSYIY